MMSMFTLFGRKICAFALCVALGSLGGGCDGEKAPSEVKSPQASVNEPSEKPATAQKPLIAVPQMIDWCGEHGMPESVCVQCNPSLAAAYKEKGDWDEQHNLPKSQCFKCDPTLKEKFAAAYKAKHGTDAPADHGHGN
jgi:cobalt-zinc-cadmium efflux system membrane fusion protein